MEILGWFSEPLDPREESMIWSGMPCSITREVMGARRAHSDNNGGIQ
jgi:hypothetical protein